MSPGSASQVTSAGSPGHDLNPPGGGGGGQHPTPLPSVQPARGSRAWVGRVGLSRRTSASGYILSSPFPAQNPAQPLQGAARVCAPTSPRKTPALLSPPFPALDAEVSPPPLGAGERQREEELGTEGEDEPSRGGVGGERAPRVWTGSHSAAGRRGPGPSRAPSDGGEEIRLDTHARTQLGTSPGGSCRLGRPGAGRRP